MSRVAVAILAAGASRRLGSPKQLLQYEGTTLVRRAAQTAVGAVCGPVLVIVGQHADLVESELCGLDVTVLHNAEWAEGIASSIRCAVRHAQSMAPHVATLLFMLCDQPLVSAALLREVFTMHESGQSIVACRYAKTVGVPALFAREYWDDLLQLRGDRGAKHMIEAHLDRAGLVDFPGGERDIDIAGDAMP